MTSAEGSLDRPRIAPALFGIVALCTVIALFDGYDGAAAGFSGPALLSALHLDPTLLGYIFSSSLVGMVVGSALFGMLADRFGRRPATIISILVFGVFTLLTGICNDVTSLIVYRLITGLGLGGALSNAVSVSSEFAPQRYRARVVSIVYSAYPMGAVLGGYLAVWLIKDFGWRSIFLVCAAAAAPLLVAVLWRFPESTRFLQASGAPADRIAAVEARFGLSAAPAEPEAAAQQGAPFIALFAKGMAPRTLLLWLAFFVNQVVVYFLFLWMPVALKTYGLGAQTGIVASATQSLGGVIGAFSLAQLIDRWGPGRIMAPAYLAALALVAAVGLTASLGAPALIITVGICGFMLNGSNVNLASVGAALYPTSARSTGIGWAMGVGKAGGIAGSVVGGYLLATHLPLPLLYAVAGTPLFMAAAALWLLDRGREPTGAPPA